MCDNLRIIKGNLLDFTIDKDCYIVQQCNATGNRSLGLSSVINKKFKNANIYSGKLAVKDRKLGTVIVRDNIINIIAQYNPGKPSKGDTREDRLKYFTECLNEIVRLNPKEIAMPYGIGCGLAGGIWEDYMKEIEGFASCYPDITIYLYQL